MFYFTKDEAEGGGAAPSKLGGNDFTLFFIENEFCEAMQAELQVCLKALVKSMKRKR